MRLKVADNVRLPDQALRQDSLDEIPGRRIQKRPMRGVRRQMDTQCAQSLSGRRRAGDSEQPALAPYLLFWKIITI